MMEQGASINNDNKCESHYQIQENRIGGVIVVVCVCFVDRCLYFCTLSFGHCVVCSSSTYGY